MAFLKYVLVGLLGSTAAAAPAVAPDGGSASALKAESIIQPNGGAVGENFQKKPHNQGTTPPAKIEARRHHRRGHRRHHRSTADSGKKATKQ